MLLFFMKTQKTTEPSTCPARTTTTATAPTTQEEEATPNFRYMKKNPTFFRFSSCGYDFFLFGVGGRSFSLFSFCFAAGVVDLATYSHRLCNLVKFMDLTSFRRSDDWEKNFVISSFSATVFYVSPGN